MYHPKNNPYAFVNSQQLYSLFKRLEAASTITTGLPPHSKIRSKGDDWSYLTSELYFERLNIGLLFFDRINRIDWI